jgi:hypothetical protein
MTQRGNLIMDKGRRHSAAAKVFVSFRDFLQTISPVTHIQSQNPHNFFPPFIGNGSGSFEPIRKMDAEEDRARIPLHYS